MRRPFELSRLRDAHPASPVVRRIVRRALAGERRPGHRVLLLPGAALAATGLVLAFTFGWVPQTVGALPELTTGARAEATGAALKVAAGRHQVEVATGSAVAAARIDSAATELRVERGSARFSVAHLRVGERFRVEAGSVVVEAVGTNFTVEREDPCVRVQVSEGTVRVARVRRAPQLQSVGEARTYCPDPTGPEVFSEEEQLLSDALTRIHRGGRGDLMAAATLLRGYHERFPDGVYSEEALYYLARIASLLGQDDEAHRWARTFLERFPRGSRADELRGLSK